MKMSQRAARRHTTMCTISLSLAPPPSHLLQQGLVAEQEAKKCNGHDDTGRCDHAPRACQAEKDAFAIAEALLAELHDTRQQKDVVVKAQAHQDGKSKHRWNPAHAIRGLKGVEGGKLQDAMLVD